MVNFIGLNENLEKDFICVCNKTGIAANLKIATKSNLNYVSHYTSETIEIVRDFYQEDIQLFQYDFENKNLPDQLIHRNTLVLPQ